MNILNEALNCEELRLLRAIAPNEIKVDNLNRSPSSIYAQSFLDSLWLAFEKSREALKRLDFNKAATLGRLELASSLENKPHYC